MKTTVTSNFFIRKLHSLLGVVPVGVFLVFHLVANSLANRGPESYNNMIAFLRSTPYLLWVEILFIYVPILLHGVYGLLIIADAENNLARYGYARNWLFFLQRVTGVIAFIFIIYHTWTLRFGELFGAPEPSFDVVASYLHNPLVFAFYAIGILGSTFHLANGLWLFGVNWGILVGPRAQRVASQFMFVVFVVVSAIGIDALLAFI